MELSEVMPHIGSVADDLCLVRSMYSEHNNHTEALVMMNTGKIFPGRPALGSWVSYALGTENQNLPAYIVLRDPEGYNTSGTLLWQNGWLPALYRGTEVSTKGAPVLNLQPAAPISAAAQRRNLDFLARLNEAASRAAIPTSRSSKPAFATTSWPRGCNWPPATLLDLSSETADTQEALWARQPRDGRLRHAAADGPPAGRERRALRAGVAAGQAAVPAVGRAHERQDRERSHLRPRPTCPRPR